MKRLPGFIGQTYQASSLLADAELAMNLYPEAIESGAGKNRMMLVGTPGLTTFATLTGNVRGLWAGGAPLTSGGRLFVVAGSTLYEVSSGGSATSRGDVGDDGTPVEMYPNGNQLLIISAGKAYIDNGDGPVVCTFSLGRGTADTVGTAVTRVSGSPFSAGMIGGDFVVGGTGFSGGTTYTVLSVTDENHLVLTTSAGTHTGVVWNTPTEDGLETGEVTARTGAFLDGYFIVQRPDSKQFNLSAINDGTFWNPLDFAIKEGYPDNIGSIMADHEELWLWGESTTEVWRNDGDANFPLVRDPGAFIHMGITAPWSKVRLKDGPAWLGGDPRGETVAYKAQGYQLVRVSTAAVEAAWRGYSTKSDARGFMYWEDGHQFWVLTFPTAGATWVYDATTDMWHQRGFWNGSANVAAKQAFHQFVFGKHLVAGGADGVIYEMNLGTFTDAGTAIHRIRMAPHLSDTDHYLFHSKFRLEAEKTGTALNPSMDYSDDAGTTYATAKTTASQAGGKYALYDWRRLGRARDRIYRITITAAAKVRLIEAYLDATSGIPS